MLITFSELFYNSFAKYPSKDYKPLALLLRKMFPTDRKARMDVIKVVIRKRHDDLFARELFREQTKLFGITKEEYNMWKCGEIIDISDYIRE